MILSVDGVSFSYPSSKVLEDVSFEVGSGDMVAILGPNGVGKSTLLRCIGGLLRPGSGEVLVDGSDTGPMSTRDRSRLIASVTQEEQRARVKVSESVLLGRMPHISFNASPYDEVVARRCISLMGIDHLADKFTDEISGGEYRMVQVARALAQKPRVLLLDEPTSNLDLCNQYAVMQKVRDVIRANDMAAVAVMHDINLALRFADRVLMVKGGRIAYAGDVSTVDGGSVEDVYGIKAYVEEVHGFRTVVPYNG
ncbi:MAG: ABC transporter ATP-binding protein [Candidatus Methanomethylophilaceae archaeon]|nr:ABC transporter ATP-binding protein [Candidatus Methanomethylophilaceae archaeon]